MIASVRGRVLAVQTGWVVLEVGGVGLRIEIPASRHVNVYLGDEIMLHTSLVVREDALTLYGFDAADELEMFGFLIQVNGVGPRIALAILSEMTPAQIARAVADEDDKPFRKVSGIGPKTSKLIVLSLAGKVTPEAFADESGATQDNSGSSAVEVNVQQGLVGLGWPESVAAGAVQDALDAGAPDDESTLLRAALALLQGSGTRGRGGAR